MNLFHSTRRARSPRERFLTRRVTSALGGLLALVVFLAGVAIADDLQADGDFVTAGPQPTIAFGTVCATELPLTKPVDLWIVKSGGGGGGNRYSAGATVAVTLPTVPANLSAASPVGTITIPSNWETTAPANAETSKVTSNVSLLASAPLGAFSQTITYLAREAPVVSGSTPSKTQDVSVTANIVQCDTDAPTASPTQSPSANLAGWNNSDVTVNWNWADEDGGSGIDAANCTTSSTSSGEGDAIELTATCKDLAGNEGSASYTVKVDKTKPTVSASASPAPNGNGWNNSNVTVSFSATDDLSGVGGCDAAITLESEGSGQSAMGSCTDNAGNSDSATADGINIDKTPPSVSVTGVSDGAKYTLGSVPAAGCNTSDGLSGVDTGASLSVSGGPVGSITATCSGATDKAGNAASASVTYSVVYNFAGLFRPVDMAPIVNVVKAGSAVPIKFSLGGDQGLAIMAAGYPKSVSVSCATGAEDTVEETVTAGSSSLSYDAAADQYVYVWKTTKTWTGCRQLQVMLVDGTMHSAMFRFTK